MSQLIYTVGEEESFQATWRLSRAISCGVPPLCWPCQNPWHWLGAGLGAGVDSGCRHLHWGPVGYRTVALQSSIPIQPFVLQRTGSPVLKNNTVTFITAPWGMPCRLNCVVRPSGMKHVLKRGDISSGHLQGTQPTQGCRALTRPRSPPSAGSHADHRPAPFGDHHLREERSQPCWAETSDPGQPRLVLSPPTVSRAPPQATALGLC